MDRLLSLEDAVKQLYFTFAPYKVQHPVHGCPCCVSVADQQKLQAAPLKQLSAHHLARFAFKALNTWGTENDFKHFLPRLFELIACDEEGALLFPELLFAKLQRAHWREWPRQEQRAIEQYLEALWTDLLNHFEGIPRVLAAEFFWGVANAGIPLEPFLRHWDDVDSVSALRHLARFVNGELEELVNGWRRRGEVAQQLADWCLRQESQERLERAFFEYEDEAFAHLFAVAADKIFWLNEPAIKWS